MKYYDIYGIEIKDGDIVEMGDPLYGEIRHNYEIKDINGVLNDRPVNYKDIPCYKYKGIQSDAWSPANPDIFQMTLNICEAKVIEN